MRPSQNPKKKTNPTLTLPSFRPFRPNPAHPIAVAIPCTSIPFDAVRSHGSQESSSSSKETHPPLSLPKKRAPSRIEERCLPFARPSDATPACLLACPPTRTDFTGETSYIHAPRCASLCRSWSTIRFFFLSMLFPKPGPSRQLKPSMPSGDLSARIHFRHAHLQALCRAEERLMSVRSRHAVGAARGDDPVAQPSEQQMLCAFDGHPECLVAAHRDGSHSSAETSAHVTAGRAGTA